MTSRPCRPTRTGTILPQLATAHRLARGAVARSLAKAGRRVQSRGDVRVARALYGAALKLDPGLSQARSDVHKLRLRQASERTALRFVAFGTTGLCNASCIHCPTGKASTSHAPRTVMPMDLFKTVIDEILVQGWSVTCMNFGLFGDGLLDPLVVERARYVSDRLPDVVLDINTNGAAFDHRRHRGLVNNIALLTLHCESLRRCTT